MRKTKKQLLGLVCLAAVALMTVFAMSLPAPGAAAAEDDEPVTSREDNTQVQVTVFEDDQASVRIQSPRNGEEFTTNVIPVSILYTRAKSIRLDYKDGEGNPQTKTIEIEADKYENGIVNTTIVLDSYIDKPTTLTATLFGINGTELEDSVQFSYRAISASEGITNKDNGNPSFGITLGDEVDHINIQVYNDKTGDPVFVDKEGKDTPLVINRDKINLTTGEVEVTLPDGSKFMGKYDPATKKIDIELPLDKLKLSEGTYKAIFVALSADDDVLSMNQVTFQYKPNTPKLPDTGSIFNNLNISQADYLVTGLIAFGLAAGFAMTLIFRRNHCN